MVHYAVTPALIRQALGLADDVAITLYDTPDPRLGIPPVAELVLLDAVSTAAIERIAIEAEQLASRSGKPAAAAVREFMAAIRAKFKPPIPVPVKASEVRAAGRFSGVINLMRQREAKAAAAKMAAEKPTPATENVIRLREVLRQATARNVANDNARRNIADDRDGDHPVSGSVPGTF